MIDLERRARRAGAGLRAWTPDTSAPPAAAMTGRAVRRTRRQRIAAGTAVLGVAAGIGLVWAPGRGHDDVRTGSDTTATSAETAPSTTTVPDPTPSTTADPATTPTTLPQTDPTPSPVPTAQCSGLIGTVPYEVTLPDSWYTNGPWAEGGQAVPACRLFGPVPVYVHLGPSENIDGDVTSFAVVWFVDPYHGEPQPTTFAERMASQTTAAGVQDVQQTTIDGRPAVRIDGMSTRGDGQPGGRRQVEWHIDLGGDELVVVPIANGVSYDEAVAAADTMVHSLHFPG